MEYPENIDGILNNPFQKVKPQILYLCCCCCRHYHHHHQKGMILDSVREYFTMVKRRNSKGAKNMLHICEQKTGSGDLLLSLSVFLFCFFSRIVCSIVAHHHHHFCCRRRHRHHHLRRLCRFVIVLVARHCRQPSPSFSVLAQWSRVYANDCCC